MVKVRKLKPMSMKRINLMLEEVSDYQLEKLDDGEIVMVKKGGMDDE